MDKRLDLVQAFLEREKPDVVCLQEVYEPDLKMMGERIGMENAFGQMTNMGRKRLLEPPYISFGVGILSRLPMKQVKLVYYYGDAESVGGFIFPGNPQMYYRVLLSAIFTQNNTDFMIGTTHFTWTPDGKADDRQRKDLQSLLSVLEQIPGILLCGDFNAPRGGEIFDAIASRYRDNIPTHYTTSLDPKVHKLGNLQLMVDGLFSTPRYHVRNVRLADGVSDHMAIVADISRTN